MRQEFSLRLAERLPQKPISVSAAPGYKSSAEAPGLRRAPNCQDAGAEAPHPPPAALGGAGPDPQLGRPPLPEIFLHRRVPARPRGAPLPLRRLRGRHAVRAVRQRRAEWEDGAAGAVDAAAVGGALVPGVLGPGDADPQGNRTDFPSEPAEPARLLQPERGRVSHPPVDVWLRGGTGLAPPPRVRATRLRWHRLHLPERGPDLLDRGRHGGSDHKAEVGGGGFGRASQELPGGPVCGLTAHVPGQGEGDPAARRPSKGTRDPPPRLCQ